jgi:hypothetical protein
VVRYQNRVAGIRAVIHTNLHSIRIEAFELGRAKDIIGYGGRCWQGELQRYDSGRL